MPGALKVKGIDHVSICVADIDDAVARWRTLLGVVPREREVIASQQTEAALLSFGGAPGAGADAGGGLGETRLELVAPRGNASLERFLEKRGPGLHHVAVVVEGVDDALLLLKSLGVPLIDETPRTGARGHKVAFVHPKATGGVLVELVEHAPTAF